MKFNTNVDLPIWSVTSRTDKPVPALGQGTWRMGESASARKAEIAALRAGIELGMTLIDSAEMYGNGAAEDVVGEAIRGLADEVFLVSKVLPSNAGYDAVLKACERSRRRLGVDTIDLYLLHWASSTPLQQTIDAFETLRSRGHVGAWGVSNFDSEQITDLLGHDLPSPCISNQVYYSLSARGIEFDLLPLMRDCGMATMAYCPLDQGELAWHESLLAIAQRHQASCAQIALAWLLEQPGVAVIPKSSSVDRVTENAGAREIRLTTADRAQLDIDFPPPDNEQPLRIV
ncbi:MAG: aldo/keto reductase [Burkholderiaceae bacterium]